MEECYKRGWISPRDGNASQHITDGFIISPAKVRKDQLRVDQLVCVTSDGHYDTLHRPSGELGIHQTLQSDHPFVLHCHPPWTLAYVGLTGPCSQRELLTLKDLFPELRLIIGPNVPYIEARTKELAQAVKQSMPTQTGAIIVLCNHGVVVTAETYKEALEIVETCEYYARIAML